RCAAVEVRNSSGTVERSNQHPLAIRAKACADDRFLLGFPIVCFAVTALQRSNTFAAVSRKHASRSIVRRGDHKLAVWAELSRLQRCLVFFEDEQRHASSVCR